MGCAAFKLGDEGSQLVLCTVGSMWDDPSSPGLAAYLNAAVERQWCEHERDLDLAREAELYPSIEVQKSETVPAELVLDWDAYGQEE